MGDLQKCADGAVNDFAKSLGGDYWPNWSGLKPSDWGADASSWRRQAGTIVGSFEKCIGFAVVTRRDEIDALHDKTLSGFSDYLYEKGLHHSALMSVIAARNHLRYIEASLKTFVIR